MKKKKLRRLLGEARRVDARRSAALEEAAAQLTAERAEHVVTTRTLRDTAYRETGLQARHRELVDKINTLSAFTRGSPHHRDALDQLIEIDSRLRRRDAAIATRDAVITKMQDEFDRVQAALDLATRKLNGVV